MTGIPSSSRPLLGSKGETIQQTYFHPDQSTYVIDSHFELERRRQRVRRRWYSVLVLVVVLLAFYRDSIHRFARNLTIGRQAVRARFFLL